MGEQHTVTLDRTICALSDPKEFRPFGKVGEVEV